MNDRSIAQPVQFGIIAAVLLLMAAVSAVAEGGPVLVPEPTFMHPPVAYIIPGSKRTVLIPARPGPDNTTITLPEKEAQEADRQALDQETAKLASSLLKSVEPRFSRNSQGVIEYAELISDSPFTACVTFAPQFQQTFEPTMGPDFLVVIPNRFQVFVFPKQATTVQEFAPMIFATYRETAHPVSVEVFEMKNNRLRAIGLFEEP